ncbi:MAG: late competence development ComFB family protein [Firmicutes bacterium]|jgi:competence protein ComFB|nr:late competence development ComFB family protein [Bacillota bacterium]
MPVHNSVLEEVQYQVNKYLATHPDALSCTCQRCRDDVVALAASRLPTRYTTTFTGRALIGFELQSKQAQLDILQAILAAIDRVNESPRHDPDRAVQI